MPLFNMIPVDRLNVPFPNRTYRPPVLNGLVGLQAAMALLIASAEEPAEMPDPHCTHEAEGMPPSTPAFLQSTARDGAMIPDQSCWPCISPQKHSKRATSTTG